jgi:putative DNA primase/helicase
MKLQLQSETLRAALEYAEGGRPVFPCKPGEKTPLTPNGFKGASLDPEVIRQWFRGWPPPNLAMPTGKLSGVVALDIDTKGSGNGFESLKTLERTHAKLPATKTTSTPSGGQHRLFEYDPGAPIGCRTGLRPGIDVRGDGGYIVLPPSSVGGRPYTWLDLDSDLAPVPAWLATVIKGPVNGLRLNRPLLGLGVPEGQRNDQIHRAACSLRARGVPKEQAAQEILQLAARCKPPLPEQEALRCMESAYARYPEGNPLALTDLGNAQRFALQHGQDLRYVYAEHRWYLFKDGVWWPDTGEQVEPLAKATAIALYAEAMGESNDERRRLLSKHAGQTASRDKLAAMVDVARSEMGIPIKAEKFDADPWLLACANGVLDLKTGKLREAKREDLLSRSTGVAFDPSAKCPTFTAFLSRIFDGNKALIEFIQRAAGYSLTGDTSEQCLFMCWGTGANGKSTLLTVLREVIGDYGIQADMSAFMARRHDGPRNDIARLRGARFCVAIETEDGHRLAEALLKQLTGQDTVAARFLYSEAFEFQPAFKLWLAANHKPTIRGTDLAIWRRIRLVPFEVTIPPAEQDRKLAEKLRAERPGILNWCLEGCLAWQRDGLREPKEVISATHAYRGEQDVLGQFVKDCCVEEESASERVSTVYRRYTEWCESAHEKPETKMKFTQRMEAHGLEKTTGTGNVLFFYGLRLRGTKEKLILKPKLGLIQGGRQ